MSNTLIDGIIKVAKSQVGVRETPPGSNRTPYGKWFPMDGSPWCAMFVSWCFAQAGAEKLLPGGKRYAGCTPAMKLAKAEKRWYTSKPQVGDIVMYDWGHNDGQAYHTGIVIGLVSGGIVTIEGNTGNPEGVYQVTRKTGILGYYRPPWPADTLAPTPTVPAVTIGKLVVDGIGGKLTTMAWQRALGMTGKDVDGQFGRKSCKLAQQRMGTTQDSRVSGQPKAERSRYQTGWVSNVYDKSTAGGSAMIKATAKKIEARGFTTKGANVSGLADAGFFIGLQNYLNAGYKF